MQKAPADKFKAIAEGRKLIGADASLESWDEYAWMSSSPKAPVAETEEQYYNRIYGEA
jgi:hypothetical protein